MNASERVRWSEREQENKSASEGQYVRIRARECNRETQRESASERVTQRQRGEGADMRGGGE